MATRIFKGVDLDNKVQRQEEEANEVIHELLGDLKELLGKDQEAAVDSLWMAVQELTVALAAAAEFNQAIMNKLDYLDRRLQEHERMGHSSGEEKMMEKAQLFPPVTVQQRTVTGGYEAYKQPITFTEHLARSMAEKFPELDRESEAGP